MTTEIEHVDVCVIGAGISGLHTAYELVKQGVSVRILEARSRIGGRIHSPQLSDDVKLSTDTQGHNRNRFDIGPSWFWPSQENIQNLLVELGLYDKVFTQYQQGDSVYEAANGQVHRGVAGISMGGSLRLQGGLRTLINALGNTIIDAVGKEAIVIEAPVSKVDVHETGTISIQYADDRKCNAQHVVIAMPARVALNTICFSPELDKQRVVELKAVATWMAGHAKAIIVYQKSFWREHGFSGDVISHIGPLSEIHDATSYDEVPALFGFFSTQPNQRNVARSEINQQLIAQLTRVFGDQAASPIDILYKDWAQDKYTATELDQHIPNHHPSNSISTIVEPEWEGRLIWSGSEMASGHYNGYVEGALLASHAALKQIAI